jgi:hypothetical protein
MGKGRGIVAYPPAADDNFTTHIKKQEILIFAKVYCDDNKWISYA